MEGLLFNSGMETIANRWRQVKQRIQEAEQKAGRAEGDVLLLAVSKTKPTSDIAALYRLGQRHFAESYVQEAVLKQSALAAFDISWHFIGPIQSNKTKVIARHFSWVHSVDRLKIARRISDQRPDALPPLNVCLQVNISGEASKSGISLGDLPELIDAVSSLPRLRLRGVMTIPEPEQDFQKQRQPFAQLYQAVNALSGTPLDTFSMGMSADLEAAIAEGATIVRVGTGLFGPRQYP